MNIIKQSFLNSALFQQQKCLHFTSTHMYTIKSELSLPLHLAPSMLALVGFVYVSISRKLPFQTFKRIKTNTRNHCGSFSLIDLAKYCLFFILFSSFYFLFSPISFQERLLDFLILLSNLLFSISINFYFFALLCNILGNFLRSI